MDIIFEKNGIFVDIEVDEQGHVILWNCSGVRRPRHTDGKWYPIVEVQCSGFTYNSHHGGKHVLTSLVMDLSYERHNLSENEFELVMSSDVARVTVHWQFYSGVKAIRTWTELENLGSKQLSLEYITSFALTGLGHGAHPRKGNYKMAIPHNTWCGEAQWKTYELHELGYAPIAINSMKRIALSSTGTWPTQEYLPMGAFLQQDEAMLWQIEAPGSWCWEVSDLQNQLYLRLSGPSWQENQFIKRLAPGEHFESVPCAIAFGKDFEDSIGEITSYRRCIRRPNEDNAHPHVVFNDGMRCLSLNPTTEREIPYIDAAAKAGCKYYCVDAGWYAEGTWWDAVGQWTPISWRFPNGIEELMAYISKKGMVPGIWIELEVMGINCPLASQLPDDWFFQIEGERFIDNGRYQLDFRNPEVIAFANEIIDRFVNQYGIGYIKMDYNINGGVGTQLCSDSAGDGLLAHNRAYLAWVDDVFARYPELVIEHCSSGGMRMTYAYLSKHSMQSVTDQEDYVLLAAIACNCMTAVTPEQAAIWTAPAKDFDDETVAFSMVSGMLMRLYQSGDLVNISDASFDLVQEGIAYHLSIIDKLKEGKPFWPIGLGAFGDPFLCVGVRCGDEAYMAVWHTTPESEHISIPMGKYANVACVYPKNMKTELSCKDGCLDIALSGVSARLLRLW